jgi:hypothetical protein
MDHLAAQLAGHESPQGTVSKFHVYSLGHAAENKALNSFDLEITPIEDTPMVDGELSTNANQVLTQGTDLTGQQYQTNMTSSGTIRATWLPVGQANRLTAPDVRRGEQVIIYRYGDTDKYYWNTMRNDLNYRKLETVVFGISATAAEGASPDQTNTYYVEFSSHKKSITLITTKANGEPYAYSFQFDTGNGKVQLEDDIGNGMFLDSQQHQWHIENADGSFFDMTKKAITGHADDSISWTTKDWSVNASNSTSEITETRTVKATTETVTAETTHNGDTIHNGNIGLNGDLTTAPGSSGTGKISIKGEAELLGDLDVKGNMTAVTIEATESILAPNLKYN